MSLIPEEFPVVLTVFLALGAWRIARSQVLTRRVPAIEALGAATVLCVDKTGTLTQNRMTVARLALPDADYEVDSTELPSKFYRLVQLGTLASQVDPFDPMELAIIQLHEQRLLSESGGPSPRIMVKEYPLSDALLAMTHVWQEPDMTAYTVAAKGAPEAIAELCRLSQTERVQLTAQVESMAGAGLRVLGVAGAHAPDAAPLPDDSVTFRSRLWGYWVLRIRSALRCRKQLWRATAPASASSC
jgi:Ca2+-transporting ATPase